MIPLSVDRALAATSTQPDRPPSVQSLTQFELEIHGIDGHVERCRFLTDEDTPETARSIVCDDVDLVDLERWR